MTMDILEAIYARRAVRLYKGDPVDDQTLRQLIDAAIHAPSAVNEQPWSFIVVRDRALLKRISQEAKAHMLKSTPAALLSHHFQELLSDPSFDIFYDAPALIVICCTTDSPWAVEDCALAAENLMLAAVAEGLGTCWIGFAQDWLKSPAGKATLNLTAAVTPMAPIIVGYPQAPAQPVPRKEPDIHWIGS